MLELRLGAGLTLGLGSGPRVHGSGLSSRRGAPSASRSIDAVCSGLVHLCAESRGRLGSTRAKAIARPRAGFTSATRMPG